jgi:hypothetical protein
VPNNPSIEPKKKPTERCKSVEDVERANAILRRHYEIKKARKDRAKHARKAHLAAQNTKGLVYDDAKTARRRRQRANKKAR